MRPASRCLSAAVFLLNLMPGCAFAQTLDEAVSQFVTQIAAGVPAKTGLSLGIENRSSLAAPELAKVRNALQTGLARAGLQMDSKSPALLQVFISENARGFLLIAQMPSQDGTKVAMAPWMRENTQPIAPLTVARKMLIIEHPAPVLDVVLANNGTELRVLEPGRLLYFVKSAESWNLDRTTGIPLAGPLPRDARGRLTPEPRFADSSTPWPLDSRHLVRWAPGRNYFADEPIGFYSAASIDNFDLKAGTDGRTRVSNSTGQLVATLDDWGSDIAAIQGSCGQWFVLASAKTEREGVDRLQPYQLTDAQPTPSGEPLAFAGAITALWPAETGTQVTAVVHNRKTGNYEVYRVEIGCGN
jgi:hypothetical protein